MGNRGEPNYCPVFKPSKEEFSRPFCDYIQKILKKNPDIPMFKVIPPAGWRPRAKLFPPLERIRISTPIKQHVFGTKGVYRCMLVEQKEMSAAEFRTLANDDDHKFHKCERGEKDVLMERAFWSQVTLKPPLYGADTPTSFFDDRLPYGWNMRNLGDLLCTTDVPAIPGVTTPMTYFGMWRSFFAWHVEDADLFSMNYLHFGAPKVWYCVSPKDRCKFDRMAQSNFPQLHQACHAFTRHKDILLSPSVLRSCGIEYMQARQQEGEFVVLNAGAYHSGFNMGFNCAEAINFATEEWLPKGQRADRCTCDALKDSVRINMSHFGLTRLSDEEDSEEDEDEDEEGSEVSGDASEDDIGMISLDGDEEVGSCSDTSNQPPPQKPKRGRPFGTTMAAMAARRAQEAALAVSKEKGTAGTPTHTAAQKVPPKRGRPFGTTMAAMAEKRARLAAAEAAEQAGPSSAPVKRAAPKPRGKDSALKMQTPVWDPPTPPAKAMRLQADAPNSAPPRLDFTEQPEDKPHAIVGDDEHGVKWFTLVLVDKHQKPGRKGRVVLQRLDEGKDHVWRPSGVFWEEPQGALVTVRSQWMARQGARRPGFKLLTLRSKILDTELHD